MNTELPPFKNGEHNSESASALDLDITHLSSMYTSASFAMFFANYDC